RDHHSGLERIRGFLAEPRGLMDLQAQPVAQPMVEEITETGFLDAGAGDGIDLVGPHTRPDRGNRALLSRQDGPIDRLEFRSDLTRNENSRQVTRIGLTGSPPVD